MTAFILFYISRTAWEYHEYTIGIYTLNTTQFKGQMSACPINYSESWKMTILFGNIHWITTGLLKTPFRLLLSNGWSDHFQNRRGFYWHVELHIGIKSPKSVRCRLSFNYPEHCLVQVLLRTELGYWLVNLWLLDWVKVKTIYHYQ